MKSIFNLADNNEFIARINSLESSTPAQWGKMNASQMLVHLSHGIDLAIGNKKLKRKLIGFLFGGRFKKKLVTPELFAKNLPTDKSFIVHGTPDFDSSKAQLIELVQLLQQKGPACLTKETHPFFGTLKPSEWDALAVKHLDHHLRQFGV